MRGGRVRIENGQLSEIADGKGTQGETRYPETKVYAQAEEGYMVDLSQITIGNVDSVINAGTVVRSVRNASAKSVLAPDEEKSFRIQLSYVMAGVSDDYTIAGRIEVLGSEDGNHPSEIALIEEMPIPVDTGILFVKIPEEPGAEEPGAEEPGAEEPGAEEPEPEELETEAPGTEEPETEKPEPETEAPGTEETEAEESETEEPETEESGAENAGTEASGIEGAGTEDSAADNHRDNDSGADTPDSEKTQGVPETGDTNNMFF